MKHYILEWLHAVGKKLNIKLAIGGTNPITPSMQIQYIKKRSVL
jgi:hypothetical protein